jgi:site-specific DNA recombinase
MFIRGKTLNCIVTALTDDGIPTPRKKTKWQTSTIESILTNEKYKGSAILQKTFTVDFLQKKKKVNKGEVPQYRVENSHPAIIDPEEWELVQKELLVRKAKGRHHNSLSPFSSKILCGDCGEYYGSKVWHSTDKYRRVIWQCNSKFKRESKCRTPHLYEDDIRRLFINAVSELISDRSTLIDTCRVIKDRCRYQVAA